MDDPSPPTPAAPDPPDTPRDRRPAPPAERFAPGCILAGRYRVVAALGRGGMGEVYRADDLTLGQSVALKFLPVHLTRDPGVLARFRHEVAAARKVSHPNVCRVYDIAEHDGQPFLSMEFIDGEDLASLLRRVGRVPEEKGVEMARQLCSALAAVHDAGLLHRDLKPANVMLDGRGKVRLTDFGLAAAAADLSETERRSGTPAYMAPEQLAGHEVTQRTDVFALGLVLYEVFTGRRAFAGPDRDTDPSRPSSVVTGLNPAVEQTILRCLKKARLDRPQSAYAVLALLPGGDPLAAAVAAGETPSPQLVADAGEVGLINPRAGAVLFCWVLVGLVAFAGMRDRIERAAGRALPHAPEEMTRRARQLLADLGHPQPLRHAAGTYHASRTVVPWVRPDAGADPPPDFYYRFHYRESPEPLVPVSVWQGPFDWTNLNSIDPSPTLGGMTGVVLDTRGRLLDFYRLPPQKDGPADREYGAPDWDVLFRAAGLERPAFRPDQPRWTPPCVCDHRAAWVGTPPGRPGPVRVEAAGYRGDPVFFRVVGDWDRGHAERDEVRVPNPVGWTVYLGLLVGAGLLALRNLRRGRADTRIALRVGAATAATALLAWAVNVPHTPVLEFEYDRVELVGGKVLVISGIVVLLYLALEPLLRRRWPWRVSAWNRLFDGRFTDPLVGRDVLIGIAAGVGFGVWTAAAEFVLHGAGVPFVSRLPSEPGFASAPTAGTFFRNAATALIFSVGFATFALLAFLVVRRAWLAWALFWGVQLLLFASDPEVERTPAMVAVACVQVLGPVTLTVFLLARYGLLAFAAALIANPLRFAGYTADIDSWHYAHSLTAIFLLTGLAGCGLAVTAGGRIFGGGFFGDD